MLFTSQEVLIFYSSISFAENHVFIKKEAGIFLSSLFKFRYNDFLFGQNTYLSNHVIIFGVGCLYWF